MGINELIAQGVRPVENPINSLAQATELQGMQQRNKLYGIQQQEAQMKLQQQQNDQKDLQLATQAYTESGGDYELAGKMAARNGASMKVIESFRQAAEQSRQHAIEEVKTKGAKAIQDAGLMYDAHQQVASLPPELRQEGYKRSLAMLQQAGIDVSQAPPDYPGDQQFQLLGMALGAHQKQVAEAEAKAKTAKDNADAQKALRPPVPKPGVDIPFPPSVEQQKARIAAAGRAPGTKDQVAAAIETAAQSLAGGDLTRLKDIASLRGDQRLLIYNRAKELNPQFSTADIDRKIKMEDSFTNGKDGQNLQSFGTFLEHAGEASDVVNQIRLGDNKYINKSLNWWRNNMSGDPRYQQMVSALEPVRKEFEGFLLGGRALYGDDRKAAETILSDNSGMAAIQGALKQMGHTVKARYNESNFRYKRTMGHDLEGAVSDEAIAGAQKIGVDIGFQRRPNGTGDNVGFKERNSNASPLTPQGGGGDGATAVGPNGHTIVVRGGKWVDAQTGAPVQ